MRCEFSINSSTHYLGFLRKLLHILVEEEGPAGLDPQVLSKSSLALVEAVNNSIFHAHGKRFEEMIDISISVDKKEIIIEVIDNGDVFVMPDFDTPPVDHVHGRGLFIIRSLMDEIAYERSHDKNVLRMILYFEG